VHPVLRKTVREMAKECPDRSAVVFDGATPARKR
jgi:hypothetical protein